MGPFMERSAGGGGCAWLDESAFVCEYDCLGSVVEVELGEDPGDVGLDSGVADDELAGDFGIGEPAGNEAQHVELARRQLGERPRSFAQRWTVRVVLDQAARD